MHSRAEISPQQRGIMTEIITLRLQKMFSFRMSEQSLQIFILYHRIAKKSSNMAKKQTFCLLIPYITTFHEDASQPVSKIVILYNAPR